MNIQEVVKVSLDSAWETDAEATSDVPPEIAESVSKILSGDSAPNRQFLLAIAAGTLVDPDSNPASLQQSAGVDRRGQAYKVRTALTEFRDANGLTLKISQDAGVSNQWREPRINDEWVEKRRKQDQPWANAFLAIVSWLAERDVQERAQKLLNETAKQIVELTVGNNLNYPRFRATPKIAMTLVRDFLNESPNRPDAMEAVVTVGVRVVTQALSSDLVVSRRDINSPDPIDVTILSSDGKTVKSGVEVTDEMISLSKIQHEVVPAMLKLGLDRVTVVSQGISAGTKQEIDSYIQQAYTHFQQQIDLVEIDVIESWLNFPGTPRQLATDFLWGIGEELDQHSKQGNRTAWFNVLSAYAESIGIQQPTQVEQGLKSQVAS